MNVNKLRETELVRWNRNRKALLDRYVSLLLDILFIDSDGRVKTTQTFELDVFLKILSENLTLYNISDNDVKRGLIRRAAFLRLKKYKRRNIYTFRRAIAAEVRNYLSRPTKEYWILFPLHVAPGELGSARSISVLGERLLFRNWDYVQGRFNLEAFFSDSRSRLHNQGLTSGSHEHDEAMLTRFSPVLILSQGKDSDEAFDKANRSFDLFRWLINLIYQFRRVYRQWGGYPKPLGKLLPPPTYGIFTSEGNYHSLFYNLTRYSDYRRNTFRGDEIHEIRKLASRLKEPEDNNATLWILIEALEKYGQALDTFEWELAFLLLWQILELVTLQSAENLNMKTVRNRASALLGQRARERDLLAALYRTRNSLVHRGSFAEEDRLGEVNLLKYIVEEVINVLFSLLRICPTRASLQRYYEHISASDSELADRQRLIRNIRRRRKQ
jgi:hypothetical protein